MIWNLEFGLKVVLLLHILIKSRFKKIILNVFRIKTGFEIIIYELRTILLYKNRLYYCK